MIAIDAWMDDFTHALDACFGNRVWFVGLQGSYARGEATKNSDIDVVVILDDLSPADIKKYGDMLENLPHRELVCGFLGGKSEILQWEPSDLFQFYHDTNPIKGCLDDLLSVIDEKAVMHAIKIGACNIYHACLHNMLHEKSENALRGLYKSASFVVQAIVFAKTGNYVRHQQELLSVTLPDERCIIETCLHLKQGGAIDFLPMSEALFLWSKKWICENG